MPKSSYSHIGTHKKSPQRDTDWLAEMRRSLRRDPRDVEARLKLGLAYRKGGDFRAAAAVWRSALELEPGNVQAKRLLRALKEEMSSLNFPLDGED